MDHTPPSSDTARSESLRFESIIPLLQRVSVEINATLELERIYEASLRTMGELFEFHHSLILLLDDDGKSLTAVASQGYEHAATGGKVRVGVGIPGQAAMKRRLLFVNNLAQQRAYLATQRKAMIEAGREEELGEEISVPGLPDAQCQIAVPLLVKDTLIGVLSVESVSRRVLEETDRALVMIVANLMASAIHAARSHRSLQEANEQLERRVTERTQELEHRLQVAEEFLKSAKERVDGALIGDSPAVKKLREEISRWAASDETLQISGPPGSGFEAIARAIHSESRRWRDPFILVNCFRSPMQTPGARHDESEPGTPRYELKEKLWLAQGGTLYLDGINGLGERGQSELLDLFREIEGPTGTQARTNANVRIIVGTTKDLFHEVQSGHFSRDLYHEIKEHRLLVPSLSDRIEDIPALVRYYLQVHGRRVGKTFDQLSLESLARLENHTWPGNVRELENVIERAIIVSRGSVLEIDEDLLGGVSVGSYQLVERIGGGGMGEVWRGRHQLLARPAAVKLIRADDIDEQEAKQLAERFEREAQVTANLRSPHTVQLYDFGISESGSFYYVMELLPGLDLTEIVRRFGPLPAERVSQLLRQACDSLCEAHDAHLVHRDIKPANLFVTKLGPEYDFLKVVDFGMVKMDPGERTAHLTKENVIAGTPAFMAPELILGEGEADGRADLYSLACSAYWMLTGRLVFEAENLMQVALHHVQKQPTPPSRVSELPIPEDLEAVLMRCLAKKPEDRPGSAYELAEELDRRVDAEPWTQARARDWWHAHAPDLLPAPHFR